MTLLARRPFIATALLVALTGAQAATGSGQPASETRELSGFSAISVRGGIDLVIRQGAREAVQVSADATLLPLLSTVVEGSGEQRTLRFQWKTDGWMRSKARALVTVDVVRLTAVSAAGSGDIKIEASLTKASVAGSGSIRQRT